MAQGTIRDYSAEERTGSLLQDDYSEVHIDPTSTEGSGLRFLLVGQRVSFEVAEESGRKVARSLRILTFD